MSWLPYPMLGTSLMNGNWLCTVMYGEVKVVTVLHLFDGKWHTVEGRPSKGGVVVAVDHVPSPAPDRIVQESLRARALLEGL